MCVVSSTISLSGNVVLSIDISNLLPRGKWNNSSAVKYLGMKIFFTKIPVLFEIVLVVRYPVGIHKINFSVVGFS